jgi:hypothetical protein
MAARPVRLPERSQDGIPDLQWIKKHVPISAVARLLGVRVENDRAAHCWRSGHQNGDRTASMWFSKRSNRGQCKVCDRHTFSNVDLVQMLQEIDGRPMTTAEAIQWIAGYFPVPNIKKKHLGKKDQPFRVGCGSRLEGLIRSGLWGQLSHPEGKILMVLTEFEGQALSYRAIQRYAGVSTALISPALQHFSRMGLLKVIAGTAKKGVLPDSSKYTVTWDSEQFEKLLHETFQTTKGEADAEKELRDLARKQRAEQLHTKVNLYSGGESVKRLADSLGEAANRKERKGTA